MQFSFGFSELKQHYSPTWLEITHCQARSPPDSDCAKKISFCVGMHAW